MQRFLVHHLLEHSAGAAPHATFLVHDGVACSYAEIEDGANRFAGLLVGEGLARGGRVAILMKNSRAYVETYYGISKAGGVAVPLNTLANAEMLTQALSDCGAWALAADRGFARLVDSVLGSLPELKRILIDAPERLRKRRADQIGLPLAEAAASEEAQRPGLDLREEDLASIIYTSGSTGQPRGVMLSHRNLCTNTSSIVDTLGLDACDRMLVVLPFYYVYGKSLLNTHTAVGASLVIENRFMYPTTALETLEGEACTGLAGVPSTFAILLDKTNLAERALPVLRYVTQAGGAMSAEHLGRLRKALPGRAIWVMYGATEAAARLSMLHPDDLERKPGSVGRAVPQVELRVLREDGCEARPGEIGEIVARGPNITSGYWGDPEQSATVLGPEGYRTGDLGRMDAEGHLFFVGRKREMIKAGGNRISPKEIEEVALRHPNVHEIAVIGVPDRLLGEAIKAFVVFRDQAREDVEGLERFLEKSLPAYKVPGSIEVLTSLPKNEVGKIMKEDLRRGS